MIRRPPRSTLFPYTTALPILLALTDHDGVSGLAEARAKAESEGVRFVDGLEISVTWEGTTVHIVGLQIDPEADRKSTRLNSSHSQISYAVFCLKKKKRREPRH